jgi:TetR/AcrR family transcriptional regulator, acrAB operon repressor
MDISRTSPRLSTRFEYAALPADPFVVEWHDSRPDPLSHLKSELVRLLGRALIDGDARQLYSAIYSRCELTRETQDF